MYIFLHGHSSARVSSQSLEVLSSSLSHEQTSELFSRTSTECNHCTITEDDVLLRLLVCCLQSSFERVSCHHITNCNNSHVTVSMTCQLLFLVIMETRSFSNHSESTNSHTYSPIKSVEHPRVIVSNSISMNTGYYSQ